MDLKVGRGEICVRDEKCQEFPDGGWWGGISGVREWTPYCVLGYESASLHDNKDGNHGYPGNGMWRLKIKIVCFVYFSSNLLQSAHHFL